MHSLKGIIKSHSNTTANQKLLIQDNIFNGSQINESSNQDLDEGKFFSGGTSNYCPTSTLKITGQKEPKNSKGSGIELDMERKIEPHLKGSTKAQEDMENTNLPKLWKRRTREETNTKTPTGTNSMSIACKRSLEELDDGDQMEVDFVKKPREVGEHISTTASAAAQHRRGQ